MRADVARVIIFESAIELFDKKGFRATSMNEIAQACSVSKPTIYHYFRSKSHLLEMLYESATQEFFSSIDELSKSGIEPLRRLKSVIEAQVVYNIQNRKLLTVFWRERHELDEPSRRALAARERAYEASLLRILRDGQAEKIFPAGPAHVQILAILGLLSTVQRWAPYAGEHPQAIAEVVSNLVICGMAGTTAPPFGMSRPTDPPAAPARGRPRTLKARSSGERQ